MESGWVSDSAAASSASTDRVLEALSESTRRYALSYLAQQSRPVSRGELAAEIAAWKRGSGDENAGDRTRPASPSGGESVREIEIELHHVHLPMLVDLGLIDETDDGYVLVDGAEAAVEVAAEL